MFVVILMVSMYTNDLARSFCNANADSIILEPSGRNLLDVKLERRNPTLMRIVD